MDINAINQILEFVETPYRITSGIIPSGQRRVFRASGVEGSDRYVLKLCLLSPTTVARIKREISILSKLQSKYFPVLQYQYFVTDQDLNDYRDSIKVENRDANETSMPPFLITVEEHIEHIPWATVKGEFQNATVIVDFLVHLFSGLNLLWGSKIVHRDIKPENILVRPNMEPVIIDLGIAKNMSADATNITVSPFPSPCTPQFAAPEQLSNIQADVTHKSDQFAVGVTAYWALTDHWPYGDYRVIGAEGILQAFSKEIDVGEEQYGTHIPMRLARFINKLLRIQPYKRFRSVDDILHELNEIRKEL